MSNAKPTPSSKTQNTGTDSKQKQMSQDSKKGKTLGAQHSSHGDNVKKESK